MWILLWLALGLGQDLPLSDGPWNDGFQWWLPRNSLSIFVSSPDDFRACAYDPTEAVEVCGGFDGGVTVLQWPEGQILSHVRVYPTLRRLDIAPASEG